MNRKDFLRKLLRTISQERTNVRMKETPINLLQQNRAEKVGGGRRRGKQIPSGMVVNEKISQEEQQPGPSRPYNNLAESSNYESSDEEEDDGTTSKICKNPWIELTMRWIYLFKVL